MTRRRKQMLICTIVIIALCAVYESWLGSKLALMFGQSATEAQAAQSAQVEPQTTQLVTLQSATGLNAGDPARITNGSHRLA